MFPLKEHISWEGHLAGAISGIALAFLYRNSGPRNPVYKFEISEAAHEDLPEWWMRGNPNHPDTIVQRAKEVREREGNPDSNEARMRHSEDENIKYHWVPRPKKDLRTKDKASNKNKQNKK
jgi:hypothetical protein